MLARRVVDEGETRMLAGVPQGWRIADASTLKVAREAVLKVLVDQDRAAASLARYYQRESNYAGATFTDLLPNDPRSVGPADLLAVTMLDVDVPQIAVRRIVEPGTVANQLRAALSDDLLSPDLRLEVATPDVLLKMWEFYTLVKQALAPIGVAYSDRWVTASKLCARKRPDLFPVRDRVVARYLDIRRLRDCGIDWQVYCALLEDEQIADALRAAVDTAARADGVQVGDRNGLLRHLDVLLWMAAPRDEQVAHGEE